MFVLEYHFAYPYRDKNAGHYFPVYGAFDRSPSDNLVHYSSKTCLSCNYTPYDCIKNLSKRIPHNIIVKITKV